MRPLRLSQPAAVVLGGNSMSIHRKPFRFAPITTTVLAALVLVTRAATAQPSATEIEKYLVIAMASDSDLRPLQTSCTELGADRIVLSTTSSPTWTPLNGCLPNLANVFGNPSSPRWNIATDPDSVNGAAALFQGIDCSGNIALTSTNSMFDASNSLFF